MDEQWNLQNETLGLMPFPEIHTSENIREKFNEALTEKKIKTEEVR